MELSIIKNQQDEMILKTSIKERFSPLGRIAFLTVLFAIYAAGNPDLLSGRWAPSILLMVIAGVFLTDLLHLAKTRVVTVGRTNNTIVREDRFLGRRRSSQLILSDVTWVQLERRDWAWRDSFAVSPSSNGKYVWRVRVVDKLENSMEISSSSNEDRQQEVADQLASFTGVRWIQTNPVL